MSRTASQVQGDVYDFLRDSDLARGLSGQVYRRGYRPRDSRLEDAEVIFTTGLPGEIETGVVTINIYCPDIDPYNNGVLVEHGQRISEIEKAADNWVKTLVASRSNYLFSLKEAIHSTADSEISQHFVVVKLNYRYYEISEEVKYLKQ